MTYTPLATLAVLLRVLYLLEAAILVTGAFFPGKLLVVAALVLFVAIAGLFVAWLHQATENVEVLGGNPRFGPGWAAGVWFLPIANAVVPYLMVADLWQRSTGPPSTGRSARTPLLISSWWAMFVGSLTLMVAQPGFREAELFAPRLLLGTSALLGQQVVRHLSRRQDRAAAAMLDTAGAPAPPITGATRRILATVSASMLVVWGAALAAGALLVILAATWSVAPRGEAPSSAGAPAILLVATAAAVAGVAALRHHPHRGHQGDRS